MIHFVKYLPIMKLSVIIRSSRGRPTLREVLGPLQSCSFQTDFVPRDPKSKPIRYKYPPFYDPYGPRPPPSDKIIQLAERITVLPPEEQKMIHPTLMYRLHLPKLQTVSVDGMDTGPEEGSGAGSSKTDEEKAEKIAFNVKLEKFDAAAKIKVIKEVRSFTNLGLKEAKDLVEKVPVTLPPSYQLSISGEQLASGSDRWSFVVIGWLSICWMSTRIFAEQNPFFWL